MRDIDIRTELVQELRREHTDPSESRIWSEFSVELGASRIDVCLINGALTGFEIKSPRDNLGRLASQVEYYGRVLDFASIVVSEKHANRALTMVPDWWGVVTASLDAGRVKLAYSRQPAVNEARDPFSIAQLLWRDEAAAILRDHGLHQRMSKATRWVMWDRLVENFSIQELSEIVRSALKARPSRSADEALHPSGVTSLLRAT